MVDERNNDGFDPDEDLFGFDVHEDVVDDLTDDEEDLEAIFAAFQAQEEAEEERQLQESNLTAEVIPDLTESVPPALPSAASLDDDALYEDEQEDDAPGAPVRTPSRTGGRLSGLRKAVASGSGSAFFSKSALLIFGAVTMVNGLVAVIVLSNAAEMRDSVLEAQLDMKRAASQVRNGSVDQAMELMRARTPLVPPDVESHPTFDNAREQIARGQYADARRQIYALLSVIDRLEAPQRKSVEARAQYLLAEALHLEALSRMEAPQ